MNLAEFGSWALAEKSVANPGVGTYKGQCVSLIQQYLYKVFGIEYKPRGNAKDWAINPLPEHLTKLDANVKLQPGDILVYGSNYGGGYGHIALIDVNVKFFDQNGLKKLAVAYADKPFSGYICVLRPKNQNALGINKSYRYAIGQVYTTQVNLKVRDGAGTGARWKNKNELSKDGQKNALNQTNAVLKAGTRVTVKEIKASGNDVWVRIPSGWIAGYYQGKVYVK
mgnify:CR=1 FL=1